MPEYSILMLKSMDISESPLAQRLSETCDITFTKTPEEFIRKLKSSNEIFSAFIMDTSDGPQEALQLIRNVREIDQTYYTPIFMAVDSLTDQIIEEGSKAGVTDILVRPYSPYVHRRVMNTIRLNEASRKLNRQNKELRAARDDLDQFLERMPGGLFRYKASFTPGEDVIDYVSPGLVSMLECATEEEFRELCGNTFSGLVHPDEVNNVNRDIEAQLEESAVDKVTYRVITKNGNVKWLEDWGRFVVDNEGVEWFYVVVLDITDKIETAQIYQTRAERDSLTKLYNRAAALEHIASIRGEDDKPCSLMLIDVDDFKGINDTYGHPFGDKVLVDLARFLKDTVRGGDIVARLGGDEFAVFVMGLEDGPRLRHLVRRISETAFERFSKEDFNPEGVRPSVSIGVASAPNSEMPVEELYDLADAALYETKRAGKNSFCFSTNDGAVACTVPTSR